MNHKKKILVVCPNNWDKNNLNQPGFQNAYHFIFDGEYSRNSLGNFEPERFIQQMVEKYRDQQLDGVVGIDDYPASLVAAIIAKKLDLPASELRSLFVCHNKYYSRQVQQKCVPEATPQFVLFDPCNFDYNQTSLNYPFFAKPVKSVFSILAKQIDNLETLYQFLPSAQQHIQVFAKPFNTLLRKHTDLELDASYFLGEEILKGKQITVDGFVSNTQVTIMGVVDSVMYPKTMSFERFEYPSKLPIPVQKRMHMICKKLVESLGLTNCMFNVEMFYDGDHDKISIIEVNPRMSYQFADMYKKVDGTNSYEIQLNIATGQQPIFQRKNGEFKTAVSFVKRLFEDKLIQKVPTTEVVKKLKNRFSEAILYTFAKIGDRLSDYLQDEESYLFAILNLGGQSWEDVYAHYEQTKTMLSFEFSDT
jgi:hypothetical protein